jgi:hypothetical protein
MNDKGYVKCPECGAQKECKMAGLYNILKNPRYPRIGFAMPAQHREENEEEKLCGKNVILHHHFLNWICA